MCVGLQCSMNWESEEEGQSHRWEHKSTDSMTKSVRIRKSVITHIFKCNESEGQDASHQGPRGIATDSKRFPTDSKEIPSSSNPSHSFPNLPEPEGNLLLRMEQQLRGTCIQYQHLAKDNLKLSAQLQAVTQQMAALKSELQCKDRLLLKKQHQHRELMALEGAQKLKLGQRLTLQTDKYNQLLQDTRGKEVGLIEELVECKELLEIREQQKKELLVAVEELVKQVERKNEALKRSDPVIKEIDEGQFEITSDPLTSILNCIHFVTQQLNEKQHLFTDIRTSHSHFVSLKEENNAFVEDLLKEIKKHKATIVYLEKRNRDLQKAVSIPQSMCCDLEEIHEELLNQKENLLWENQACHSLLLESCGKLFMEDIRRKRKTLEELYRDVKGDEFSPIDNRYVTVRELIQKNQQLMTFLRQSTP